jgi:hypothetical protein
MAIDDANLAEVWPELQPGVSPERNRQFLYTNLILQYAWLKHRISDYTEAEMRSNLRYLFGSPVIHDYWLASAGPRSRILVPGTDETGFDQIAEEVFREYVDSLATADAPNAGEPDPSRETDGTGPRADGTGPGTTGRGCLPWPAPTYPG